MVPATLAAAVSLAVLHLVAGKMRFLGVVPRSRWLSAAGGASVAYIFVHLLPELNEHQSRLQPVADEWLGFLEHHVYLMALAGFATFYGLERLARRSREGARPAGGGPREEGPVHHQPGAPPTTAGAFWVHTVSFAVYNATIGYVLVHREEPGAWSLAAYAVAMGLHFLVNDYGLRDHHKHRYDAVGRWMLAGAVLVGWGIGGATTIHAAALGLIVAFIGGGVILNVIKEELPEERESRFWAFAAGAGAYAAVLLMA